MSGAAPTLKPPKPTPKPLNARQGCGCLLLIVAIFAGIVWLSDKSKSTTTSTAPTSAPTAQSNESMALQIVAASGDSPAAYKQQLDLIAPHCDEPRDQVAGMPAVIQETLRKRGVNESMLSIITNGGMAAKVINGTTRCADIFAAYATLRIPR